MNRTPLGSPLHIICISPNGSLILLYNGSSSILHKLCTCLVFYTESNFVWKHHATSQLILSLLLHDKLVSIFVVNDMIVLIRSPGKHATIATIVVSSNIVNTILNFSNAEQVTQNLTLLVFVAIPYLYAQRAEIHMSSGLYNKFAFIGFIKTMTGEFLQRYTCNTGGPRVSFETKNIFRVFIAAMRYFMITVKVNLAAIGSYKTIMVKNNLLCNITLWYLYNEGSWRSVIWLRAADCCEITTDHSMASSWGQLSFYSFRNRSKNSGTFHGNLSRMSVIFIILKAMPGLAYSHKCFFYCLLDFQSFMKDKNGVPVILHTFYP